MVRPVGYVHHVVPFRPKALPKPIMKLLPLFPGYEEKEHVHSYYTIFLFVSLQPNLYSPNTNEQFEAVNWW